jgi:carboxylate-amine ligase
MPTAEDCWLCLDALAPWLPVVLALSANSPWFGGELTGMASNRAPVLAELPRGGAPAAFASYAEWEQWVERLVALGVMEDYTRTWWDVRPHPALGTLEVRVPDQPTDVRLSSAFAALVQAMCATALDGGLAGASPRVDYVQNRWSAARFGPRARLIHPDGGSFPSATELAVELLERVRPAADRLGTTAFLDRFDPTACEADLQSRAASPEEAAAGLVRRSLA